MMSDHFRKTTTTSPTNSFFDTHIQSPIKFDKQTKRQPINGGNLHEERFVTFNSMPQVISKYKKAGSPDFAKTSAKQSNTFGSTQMTSKD